MAPTRSIMSVPLRCTWVVMEIVVLLQLFGRVSAAGNLKLTMVESPNMIAWEGSNVTLVCKFNQPVSCKWKHDGRIITPDNQKYAFADAVRGQVNGAAKRSDCSLSIHSANQTQDGGKWRCMALADSSYAGIESKETELTVQQGFRVGQPARLLCPMKLRTETCVWLRNGTEVPINGSRYRLLPDCNLDIDKFGQDDAAPTEWECRNRHDKIYTSGPFNCVDDVSRLPPTVQQLLKWVTLDCTFSVVGDCVWKRRGQRLALGDRYTLQSTAQLVNSTDCSINILSFAELDVGDWQCTHLASDRATCSRSRHFMLIAKDSNSSFTWQGLTATAIVLLAVILATVLVKYLRCRQTLRPEGVR